MGDREEKTWTSQQIPPGVHGAKPRPDKEPMPNPTEKPDKRR
jgi:hypothetical protein